MPSFYKKKSEKANALQAQAWHTNFRNFAVLPDTKLVRTSFFVNGLLVFVAVGLVLAFAYQEYRLSDLRSQTSVWQKQNDHNRTASNQAVALYKKFQTEERKINELNTFVKGQRLNFSDFIIRLSQTKPLGIVFVSIEYRETGATIKCYAQGVSEQATGAASAYEKQLKEDPEINSRFHSISMTNNITRDTQAGRLFFEILLNFSQAKAK
jgi:hypothetical protein